MSSILASIASTTPTTKAFEIVVPHFSSHYDVKTTSGDASFYVDMSKWTPGKPHLTLHQGSQYGAAKAFCFFKSLSKHIEIGLGDPAKPSEVRYGDMTSPSTFGSKHYRWTAHDKKVYLWRKAKPPGVRGSGDKELVAEGTEEVLALFKSKGSRSKPGTLEIKADRGPEFDLMIIMTFVTLYHDMSTGGRGGGGGGSGGTGGAIAGSVG